MIEKHLFTRRGRLQINLRYNENTLEQAVLVAIA
jgi:hypothetical protein